MERSGAKRARRGAARLMSLAHDVIGSGAREAALIGVKKINAYRTQKLQTAMSLHNSTTGRLYVYLCTGVRISNVILFSRSILFVCFFFHNLQYMEKMLILFHYVFKMSWV